MPPGRRGGIRLNSTFCVTIHEFKRTGRNRKKRRRGRVGTGGNKIGKSAGLKTGHYTESRAPASLRDSGQAEGRRYKGTGLKTGHYEDTGSRNKGDE